LAWRKRKGSRQISAAAVPQTRSATQRNRGSRGLERDRGNAVGVAEAKKKQNPNRRKSQKELPREGKKIAAAEQQFKE